MKQDKFLTGILIGIGALIIVALAVFFTRRSDQSAYVADDTPEGVVHNYVLAILNKDYQKAYTYLADLKNKPTYDSFRSAFATGRLNQSNAGIKIGDTSITGDDATVQISMVYSPGDPFSTGLSNVGSAQLVRQNGVWKLSSFPAYNFWDYSWYTEQPK